MKVVSVINYKGGVGKTTLVSNLAAYAAAQGKRVLMIDLDPQMSLTLSFVTLEVWKDRYAESKTLRNFFNAIKTGMTPPDLSQLVIPISGEPSFDAIKLDLISSHLELIDIDLTLASLITAPMAELLAIKFMQYYNQLRFALARLKDKYDLVMLDCPPNFYAVVKNAVTASDYCLVPAKMDYLSSLGVGQLQDNLNKYIQEYLSNLNIYNQNKFAGAPDYQPIATKILGVVPMMVEIQKKQPVAANAVFINQLKDQDNLYIFKWVRNNTTLFGSVPSGGVPVVLSCPKLTSYMTWRTVIKPELDELGREFMQRAGI